jgi:hypothetical protein
LQQWALVPYEEEAREIAVDTLTCFTCLHTSPGIQTLPWKRVPCERVSPEGLLQERYSQYDCTQVVGGKEGLLCILPAPGYLQNGAGPELRVAEVFILRKAAASKKGVQKQTWQLAVQVTIYHVSTAVDEGCPQFLTK